MPVKHVLMLDSFRKKALCGETALKTESVLEEGESGWGDELGCANVVCAFEHMPSARFLLEFCPVFLLDIWNLTSTTICVAIFLYTLTKHSCFWLQWFHSCLIYSNFNPSVQELPSLRRACKVHMERLNSDLQERRCALYGPILHFPGRFWTKDQ